jgi:hypothetical protein
MNWLLIAALSMLTLVIALFCSLCCWYHLWEVTNDHKKMQLDLSAVVQPFVDVNI